MDWILKTEDFSMRIPPRISMVELFKSPSSNVAIEDWIISPFENCTTPLGIFMDFPYLCIASSSVASIAALQDQLHGIQKNPIKITLW